MNSRSTIDRIWCRSDRIRVEKATNCNQRGVNAKCSWTYEREVLGLPDIVVIDGDKCDSMKTTSNKFDKAFIAHAHAQYDPDE